MEIQNTSNSQSSLEKKKKMDLEESTCLTSDHPHSCSHQDSMLLTQTQECRPREQARKPGDKPGHL